MPLIKSDDIATLRKYVKMNFTATAVKSMPDLDAAERKFLIPIITQPVFDALQTQVTTGPITWAPLLNLCRAAIAPLAIWLDLPFYQANLNDSGLKTTYSDNEQATHQWEYNKIETALVNKGMAALEDLITHLLASGSTYSWTNDDLKESFFKTGNEFSNYAVINQPNLTFQHLKPLIKEVEDHFIRATIGDTFFAELRDKASPSAEEKKAILLIKKAIANYTLVRAVERLPVRITPNGLMASLQSNSEAFNVEAPAGRPALHLLMTSCQREGDAYQGELMQYLNKTASSATFNTYFTSAFYKAPTTEIIDPNINRNGVCSL